MYKGILHTHIFSVILFLLIYVIKTFLLLANKNESLQKFRKATKVPEMIISTLFLVTGIYLFVKSGTRDTFLYIKLICVVVSIPLAVIGFKKSKKPLAVLSLLLLIMAYGLAEMHGKRVRTGVPAEDTNAGRTVSADELYINNCAMCHGEKGDAGLSGATDLSGTQLDRQGKIEVIANGKGAMPKYEQRLTKEQIESLADYIETLKK